MPYVSNFKDLDVYKASRKQANDIFVITRKFPHEELYSLTDQIRRSSRSVGAQVAEAWGKRRYVNHFISKLTDADAELNETQHWIEVAWDCNYLNAEEAKVMLDTCASISKMLNSMISKANLFCFKQEIIR